MSVSHSCEPQHKPCKAGGRHSFLLSAWSFLSRADPLNRTELPRYLVKISLSAGFAQWIQRRGVTPLVMFTFHIMRNRFCRHRPQQAEKQSCHALRCRNTTCRTQGRFPERQPAPTNLLGRAVQKTDSFLMISVWRAATPLILFEPMMARWPMRIFLTSPSSTMLKAAMMGPSPHLQSSAAS